MFNALAYVIAMVADDALMFLFIGFGAAQTLQLASHLLIITTLIVITRFITLGRKGRGFIYNYGFILSVCFYLCMCRLMYICTGFTTCICPAFYAVILLINISDIREQTDTNIG